MSIAVNLRDTNRFAAFSLCRFSSVGGKSSLLCFVKLQFPLSHNPKSELNCYHHKKTRDLEMSKGSRKKESKTKKLPKSVK